MRNNPKYSDSVNAMNGCLLFFLKLLGLTMGTLLLIAIAPYVGILLLGWWIIAWILGLFFPGKEFFPIKKLFSK
jgi:hypothetical protein